MGKNVTARMMLDVNDFRENPRKVLVTPAGEVTLFKYKSGVPALEIETPRTSITVLPFRGQQIWRYAVDGEDPTMRTTFAEPSASRVFGETYGAFLVHCGLTGIGAPGVGDQHDHHGELPGIENTEVTVLAGELDGEAYLGLESTFEYRLSHGFAYRARIELKVFADQTVVPVKVTITNLRSEPFDYAYLCHVNWKLEDLVSLEQSASNDAESFVLAPHPGQTERTAALLEEYAADPGRSNIISVEEEISPEYCAVLTPIPTESGKAEFLGVRSDESALWVSFDTQQLPRAIRWMSNTGDEQAAGFCLPATGHHFGRNKNQQDGLLKTLAAGASTEIDVTFGKLSKEEARIVSERIEESRARS